MTLDEKQLNEIIKLYYFHTLKALWHCQGKINVYYRMSRVKKHLSGKGLLHSKGNLTRRYALKIQSKIYNGVFLQI